MDVKHHVNLLTSLFLISPGLWLMLLLLLVEVLLYVHRNRRLIRDGEPRTATSTFTQLLSSDGSSLEITSKQVSGIQAQWPYLNNSRVLRTSAGKIPQAGLNLCDVTIVLTSTIPTNKHVTLGIMMSSGFHTNVTHTTQNTGLHNTANFLLWLRHKPSTNKTEKVNSLNKLIFKWTHAPILFMVSDSQISWELGTIQQLRTQQKLAIVTKPH